MKTASWWHELRSVALIGVDRRGSAPPLTESGLAVERADASVELAVLDGAALGAMQRLAGSAPLMAGAVVESSPAETRVEAPPGAVQMLELLLTSAPVVAGHRDELLSAWFAACDAAQRRVPARLLVAVLDGVNQTLRAVARPCLGMRGAWLARLNPAWEWAASGSKDASEANWATASINERVALLKQLRGADPAKARELLQSTIATDSPKDRARQIEALAVGLSQADEPFLEALLEERSAYVRGAAAGCLSHLTDSSFSQRMATDLRGILSVDGRRRKRTLVVSDPASLAIMYAPLSVWTDVSGEDETTTLSMVLHDEQAMVRLTSRILDTGDPVWLDALMRVQPNPTFLRRLPQTSRESYARDILKGTVDGPRVTQTLDALDHEWSADFSRFVIERLQGQKNGGTLLRFASRAIASGLHPDTMPRLEAWLNKTDDAAAATTLRAILQYHSFRRAISEAFT